MDKRAILFLVLSTGIIFLYISLEQRNMRPPPARDDDQEEQVADADQAGKQNGQADADQNDQDAGTGNQAENDPNATDQDGGPGSDTGPDGPTIEAADSDAAEPRLLQLGSLVAGSEHRMLGIFDTRGAIIRHLELGERMRNGRFRYRETEKSSGYFGNLDLKDNPNGVGAIIGVVGEGTPAGRAVSDRADWAEGLQSGDVIVGVDDEAIDTANDLNNYLDRTRPGESIAMRIRRDGAESTFTAELEHWPLQIVAPEYDAVDPTYLLPGSFLLSLGTLENGIWKEFSARMRTDHWHAFLLTHVTTSDTEFYESGPQQGRPADGVFPAGTLLELMIDDDESRTSQSSYHRVRTDDGRSGFVDLSQLTTVDQPSISFTMTLSDEELSTLERSGPIQVVKRYSIAQTPVEEIENSLYPSYHLDFAIEIRNLGSEPQKIAYQLGGPTGAPTEGWWFATKIHGRSTAVGYSAGARDVTASSVRSPFIFLGAPEIFTNELKRAEQKRDESLSLFPAAKEDDARTVNFVGVDAQYFNVSLIPEGVNGENPLVCFSGLARVVHPVTRGHKKFRKLAGTTFELTSEPFVVEPYKTGDLATAYHLDSVIFAGPKEPRLLREYGLQDNVSFGWFAWFSKPLVGLLHLFYAIVGNYGLAIIMLTVLVRGAMIPISRKAVRNAQMMQYLQPELKRIADKYKNDFEKRGQAQRELFRRYNYNPFGGCLLIFLQLPIFIGLYRGLSVDIALRDQPLIPGLQWASNLAAPDKLFRWDGIPMSFLFSETGWLGPYFNILPIITIVLFLVQQKLFTPPATDEQMRMTQRMMTYMMIFIGVLFFKVPSGLCVYFITSSLWGIAERKLLPKPKLPDNLPPITADGAAPAKQKPAAPVEVLDKKVIEEKRELQKQRRKKLKGR